MIRNATFGLVLILALGSAAWAAPPQISPGPDRNILEQGIIPLFIQASDPEQDALTIHWAIESDPTGRAFFLLNDGGRSTESGGSTSVRVGLEKGPNFPAASFVGQTIAVRVTASDAESSATHLFNLSVAGVNRPPTVVIDATQMGTVSQPRLSGQGMGIDARASSDPDGTDVKFLWRITRISGGQPCETGLVLFGKETPTPGLPVPTVSARPGSPMSITIDYTVEDDLNVQSGSVTGYMASENGCDTNTPPVVSASASPAHASFGQRVTLLATATDPGDQLSYSWVQLDTTGEPTVALSNPRALATTFIAPAAATNLVFRFTATDSRNQQASAEVSVRVSSQAPGGGGGNPGEPAPGEAVCGQEGNQPAVAELPGLVEARGGETVTIRAERARDPDETEVFVGGILNSGVSFLWEVLDGAGILGNSDLRDSQSAAVAFSVPDVSEDHSLLLSVLVSDAAGCGTRYAVGVQIEASTAPSGGPEAVLRYRFQDDESLQDAPSTAVNLTSPNVVVLDAFASRVTGSASFQFHLEHNLEGGGAQLVQINKQLRHLQIQERSFGTASVTLTVSDESGLSSIQRIDFQVEAPNEPPRTRVEYRLEPEGQLHDLPLQAPLEVSSPAEVVLDASSSTDEDTLSFAFVMQEDLLSGGAVLTQPSQARGLLQIQPGTQGSLRVTVTATDLHGLSDSVSATILVRDSHRVPHAVIEVMSGDRPWNPEEAILEDTIVQLDGSASQLEGGDQPENLSYFWRQTGGVPVALMGADSIVARFRVPELDSESETLRFELIVSHEGQESDPAAVEVSVSVSPLYFSQVAFGPFRDQRFQTVLLLINRREADAEAFVELFDQAGQPLAVQLEGEPEWNPALPLTVEAGGSRRLRFSPQDPGQTVVGWARVRSNLRLTGLVLYQLRDRLSGGLKSEVSLYSSPAAERHRTFFDPGYGLAAALLNPGLEPTAVRLALIDEEHGPDNPIAAKTVTLEPASQSAFFLDETFFGDFGEGFQDATLLIEVDGGQVSATVLKTLDGVAISSLPLASR